MEFALVLPVLLLILFGAIEFGRIMFMYSSISGAAREAARYGVATGKNEGGTPRYLDCAGMRAAARRVAVLSGLSDAEIQIDYDRDNLAGDFSVFSDCDSAPAASSIVQGDRVVVTVTTTFRPIVPIVPIPDLPVSAVAARTILKSIALSTECNDGLDNDGDLAVDYPADDGCSSRTDNSETSCHALSTPIVNPPGSGSVAVNLVSGQVCAGGYVGGSVLALQATPNGSYQFGDWSGDASGSANPLALTMDADKSVTANFVEQCSPAYSLSTAANPGAGGSVGVSPAENCVGGGYRSGTAVTLNANPNAGYTFQSWSGDASGSANPLALTMDASKSVTANFCGVSIGGISKQDQEIVVSLSNNTGSAVTIDSVTISWPSGNTGALKTVQVSNNTVWSGSAAPTSATISAWSGPTSYRQISGNGGSRSLEFDFAANKNKTASTGYTITVHFSPSNACPNGVTASN